MTQPNEMHPFSTIKGEFAAEDWKLIRDTLVDNAIRTEQQLIADNAGDTEWYQLDKLDAIIKDINYFILNEREL